MRLIGYLDSEPGARMFSNYLYVQGIDNQLEFAPGEGWAIWVNDEEKLQNASALLNEFRSQPGDPKYQQQGAGAEKLREERAAEEEAWRKRLRNRRHLFRPLTGYGFGPLTFVLIAISVVVFLRSALGSDPRPIQSLFITQFVQEDHFIRPDLSLPEVRHGEVWRLFTPMFIHLVFCTFYST